MLLGCIPLAFASALVRYRLMDIEVIFKKALAATAIVVLLGVSYALTRNIIRLFAAPDQEFWALFATLIVALVAPLLRQAVQGGLDRLHYRDRYDYRRALVGFARELNTDLDLDRLATRLVARVRETFAVERIALYAPLPGGTDDRMAAVASEGFGDRRPPVLLRASALGARLVTGQTIVIDDPVPLRRLSGEDAAPWRAAGLFAFVPCVSSSTTIAVLAIGRLPDGEPLSSEDMTLVSAVALQAATALENARLYGQLRATADEADQLRQFSESVVESLTDGLVVVNLEDKVLRCNRRAESLVGRPDHSTVGQPLSALFSSSFVDALQASRRESPGGATLYRVPITRNEGGTTKNLLVNVGIAPLRTADGQQAGWILVLQDITDRANLEEQLRLSEKMAAIGLLAAGVAHEVNTPLTGISSFTQMLLERSDPGDPRTQLLEKIERQTFRAAKIVNSLLNLARPTGAESGPAPVDINGVDRRRAVAPRASVPDEPDPGAQGTGVAWRHRQRRRIQAAAGLPESLSERPRCDAEGRLALSLQSCRRRPGRRRGRRYGRRHSARAPRAHLRSVFHDEARRPRHRIGPVGQLRHRPGARRHADVYE